ncbi:thioredoxin-disulfide reductase [Blattabacterium cuenoti]|uniref:thioredoxin-disulfide reductase n=1 Tax=Blattabacterium cuenoti TaxID=1653831 RepID=UPI00163CE28D|nr:thioredoxin-disulfide reductase [Blattabacterium cuenoti]
MENCVIIGSGPAGYTAAIYAARADIKPVLFTGNIPGGQLTTTTNVDNYPGFPEGISGNKLVNRIKKQAIRFNTKIIDKTITEVRLSNQRGGIHRIIVDKKNIIESKGVIIATGSSPKFLGIDGENKLIGLGISFCATCDGFFHKGKDVAIVGGGDTALEEASFLSKICRKVYLVIRKKSFKASKILQNRILKKKNIIIFFCSQITKIIGNNFLEGIQILQNKTNKIFSISGLFIAIGHNPNTELFKNQLKLDEKGYILVKNGSTATNKPGVFSAGDVQDSVYRQAITSAGTGCMAAIDLEKYLFFLS